MLIILCLSGCKRKNEQNQTIDDKIAIEISFLDKEISKFIDIVTGNIETSYEVEEEKTSIKSTDENNNESNKSSENNSKSTNENNQDSSNESSEQSEENSENGQENQSKQSSTSKKSEELTIMSMQYNGDDYVKDEDWEKIKIEIENLYTSWAVIENDISTKDNINQEEIKKIDKNFDNLLLISIEKNRANFIKETVDFYNNIINIAEKVNYDKNQLNMLKVKNKLYEVYYNVEEKDWGSAKNNIILANDYSNKIENMEEKVKILLQNIKNSIEQENKEVFIVKYSDIINELNYVD